MNRQATLAVIINSDKTSTYSRLQAATVLYVVTHYGCEWVRVE